MGEGRGENVIALLSAKNRKSHRFSCITAFGRAGITFVACDFIGTRTYFCDFGSQIGGTVPSFRWGLSVSCLGKECYQHPLGSGLGHASTDLLFFLSWST